MKNKQEFDRLCKIYPLFELSVVEHMDRNKLPSENLVVKISRSATSHHKLLSNGRLEYHSVNILDNEHMLKSISKTFMEQYPDLYISAYCSRHDITLSVWVLREGHDSETIGHISLTDKLIHEQLNDWQKEAHQSKEHGYFYCSGHHKAEPKTDYGYFYFAGRYCKQYGENHPEQKSKALREDYN